MYNLQLIFRTIFIQSIILSAAAIPFLLLAPAITKKHRSAPVYYMHAFFLIMFIIPISLIPRMQPIVTDSALPSSIPVQLIRDVKSASYSYITATGSNSVFSLFHLLAAIWITGIVSYAVFHIYKHYRLMKLCKKWGMELANNQLISSYQSLCKDFNISTQIALYKNPLIKSPFIAGVIKPRIFLPDIEESYQVSEILLMLKHELIHWKRRDNQLKILGAFVSTVYWFNPVVHLLNKSMNLYCEISCDEQLLHHQNTEYKKEYGTTLIRIIRSQTITESIFINQLYGGKSDMKKRLNTIIGKEKTKSSFSFSILAAAALLFAASFVPKAYATEPNSATKEQVLSDSYENASENAEISSASDASYDIDDDDAVLVASDATASGNYGSTNEYFAETYGQFGLEYNKENGSLYYEGKRVKCFADRDQDPKYDNYSFAGSVSQDEYGEIFVAAEKDADGNVVALKTYDMNSFDQFFKAIKN